MNRRYFVLISVFLLLFIAQSIGCCSAQPRPSDYAVDGTYGMCMPPAEEQSYDIDGKEYNLGERIMLSLLAVRVDAAGPVIGSGVYVEVGGLPYMMTAYHVVDHMVEREQPTKQSACHVDVYSREENCVDILIGPEYNDITMFDRARDAALVPLSGMPDGAYPAETPVEGYQFRIGEEVLVIGCPTGIPDILTRGIVTGFAAGDRDRPMTDAATWFGTSGGGVFLTTGEYVGYFHSMIGSRTPNGREMAEGLHIFSPLPMGWGLVD